MAGTTTIVRHHHTPAFFPWHHQLLLKVANFEFWFNSELNSWPFKRMLNWSYICCRSNVFLLILFQNADINRWWHLFLRKMKQSFSDQNSTNIWKSKTKEVVKKLLIRTLVNVIIFFMSAFLLMQSREIFLKNHQNILETTLRQQWLVIPYQQLLGHKSLIWSIEILF